MLFSLITLFACNDNLLFEKGSAKEGDNPGECTDLIDNDEDGYTDCDDQDCNDDVDCQEEVIIDTADTDDTDDSGDSGVIEDSGDSGDVELEDLDSDGFTEEQGDCDDSNAAVNPDGSDSTVDGVDQNCDGVDGPDADNDGFADLNAGGTDCDDSNAAVNPNATEVPDDGIDNDCLDGDAVSTPAGEYTIAGEYELVVPANVTQIQVELWGGGGAGGDQTGSIGGGGGFVSATLSVTPAESLMIYVGEGGTSAGEGAGASFVFRGTAPLAVAGGGGGGASDGNSGNSYSGGAGGAGGQVGQDGQDLGAGPGNNYCSSATGGDGATQTAGGYGGIATGTASYNGISHVCTGVDGTQYNGGGLTGVASSCNRTGPNYWTANGGGGNGHSGSGGAGYYGGGGGGAVYTYCGAGGGGGSSWVVTTASLTVYLDGAGRNEGNTADSQGSGHGGDRGYSSVSPAGVDGRVEITW